MSDRKPTEDQRKIVRRSTYDCIDTMLERGDTSIDLDVLFEMVGLRARIGTATMRRGKQYFCPPRWARSIVRAVVSMHNVPTTGGA